MKKRKIVEELQADAQLHGECPKCGGTFSLKKAVIFHVEDPFIPEAKKWVENINTQLAERENELKTNKKRIKELVPKSTETINRGKILEKIVPAYTEIKYQLADFRSLFEPIDYILFKGLSKNRKIESIKFIDCKTGGAGLNQHQKEIKSAVENDNLTFETYSEVKK